MSVICPVRSPLLAAAKRVEKPRSARRVGRALSFKQKKSLKPKKQRKSRVLYHYTKEELEPYFHISQKEAAKRLGVAVITLKRICKRGNFNWPYRANKTKEAQDRNENKRATMSAPTRLPKSRKVKKVKARRSQPSTTTADAFAGETRATHQEMCRALQSLAFCAFKLEQEELQDASMTTAAMAFSRLPLMCMMENSDVTITL